MAFIMYAYMLMYVAMHLLVCEYINVQICLCANVLMCSTKLSTALSPSKFYCFFGRKCSEITSFFKTSKHLFHPRFHLSVSPDCKMCVRVTNTGEIDIIACGRLNLKFILGIVRFCINGDLQ